MNIHANIKNYQALVTYWNLTWFDAKIVKKRGVYYFFNSLHFSFISWPLWSFRAFAFDFRLCLYDSLFTTAFAFCLSAFAFAFTTAFAFSNFCICLCLYNSLRLFQFLHLPLPLPQPFPIAYIFYLSSFDFSFRQLFFLFTFVCFDLHFVSHSQNKLLNAFFLFSQKPFVVNTVVFVATSNR